MEFYLPLIEFQLLGDRILLLELKFQLQGARILAPVVRKIPMVGGFVIIIYLRELEL